MAEKKKAYRKVVRKPDGKVRVAFIDAETGLELDGLDGYELVDSGGFDGPVFPATDNLEQAAPVSSQNAGGGNYSPAEPFDWDAFQNRPGASRGSGNIIQDLARTWTNVKAGIQDAKQTAFNAGAELLGIPTTTTGPGAGVHKEQFEREMGVDLVPGGTTVSPLATPNTTTPTNGAYQPAKNLRGNMQGVDPRTLDIINEAALRSPYIVQIVSGKDHRDRGGQHPKGHAIDIELVDPDTGKVLPNYQHGPTFRAYEQFAQTTKVVQTNKYPELDNDWVWGGYFWNGGPGNYGNMDSMHFDIGGRAAAGTWEQGLKPEAKSAYSRAYPGFSDSKGMGNPKQFALTEPGTPIPGIVEDTRSALATPADRTPSPSQAVSSKLQEAIGFLPQVAKSVMSARIPLDGLANMVSNLPGENIRQAALASGLLSPQDEFGIKLPYGDVKAREMAADAIRGRHIPSIDDIAGDGPNFIGGIGDFVGGPAQAVGDVVDDLLRAFPQAQQPTATALATAKQTPKQLETNMTDTSAALGPYSLNDKERRRIIAQTILGEAAGEGVDGMAAVANVIKNRALSGDFPTDPKDVALQKGQFSAWNSTSMGGNQPDLKYPVGSKEFKVAANIADMVFKDLIPDNTGGAVQFHTPDVSPSWSREVLEKTGQPTFQLGNHVFYPTKPVEPVLNATASALATSKEQTTLNKSSPTPVSVASYNRPSAIPEGSPRNLAARDSSAGTTRSTASGSSDIGSPFAPLRTSPTQKVTAPTGGNITVAQRDAISSGNDSNATGPGSSFMSGPHSPKPRVSTPTGGSVTTAQRTAIASTGSSGNDSNATGPGSYFSPSKSPTPSYTSKSTASHNPAARDSSAGTTKSTRTSTTTRRDPWGGGAR